MKVSLKFRWYDLWVGVFIDRESRAVFICPLPCVVVKLSWGNEQREMSNPELRILSQLQIAEGQGYKAGLSADELRKWTLERNQGWLSLTYAYLDDLVEKGLVERSRDWGKQEIEGQVVYVFLWKITDAGRQWLALRAS